MGSDADKKPGEFGHSKYCQLIGTENPGLITILVDQSGSMADNGKMNWAAEAFNRTILEIISSCRGGSQIKDRLFLGVIGYGDSVDPLVGGKISEVATKSLRVERTVSDNFDLPIWVEPKAKNGTPMAEAFRKAADLVGGWATGHQNSFPPVVINITDGAPDDFDEKSGQAHETQRAAAGLMQIQTNDGQLLLFNIHVSGLTSLGEILLPNSPDGLPDAYAKLLFSISSVLPHRMLRDAELAGLNPRPGSRGFAFNAKSENLVRLLAFGSSMATRAQEPASPTKSQALDTNLCEPLTSPNPAEMPKYLHDNVQFTVYRPKTVKPRRWYPLLAFAHLSERPSEAPVDEPDPLVEVERQARMVLGELIEDYRNLTQDSAQPIPHEGDITFVPQVEGIDFNPPRRTFQWEETVHREEFRLRARPELDSQTARGRVTVFLGVILVAEISLSIKVDSAYQPTSESLSIEKVPPARPYRKIFASYSRFDQEIVPQVANYVRAVGDRYLIDLADLRAGEVWNEQLRVMIAQADLFQLFWSWNSMKSFFVKNEWEYALSLGRPNFVRPCYWEEPLPENHASGLPPDDLRKLHFERLEVQIPGSRPLAFCHPAPAQNNSLPEPTRISRTESYQRRLPEQPSLRRVQPTRSVLRKASWGMAAILIGVFALYGYLRHFSPPPAAPVKYAARMKQDAEADRNHRAEVAEHDRAIEYYKQSLAMNRKIGDAQGEIRSLSNLGSVYSKWGQYDRAVENYEKSLEMNRRIGDVQGEMHSLSNLGSVYSEWGQYDRAVENYEKSLEMNRRIGDVQGEIHSLDNLGRVYSKQGQYSKAIKFYAQAAQQGDPGAQNALGDMYAVGLGVPKDYHEAAKWYRRAAEQGDPGAQYNLAEMYRNGLGVPKDSQEAIKWLTEAAEKGFNPAKEQLQKIREPGSK